MSEEHSNRPDQAAAGAGHGPRAPSTLAATTVIDDTPVESLLRARRTVARGRTLFRLGDPFAELFVVRSGLFKTRVALAAGRDQITGFHMPGDILGLDAVAGDVHRSDAVSLDDSEVGVLDFASLTSLARRSPQAHEWLCRVMGLKIAQLQSATLMLGRMRADERVASFLATLAHRHAERGMDSQDLVLQMTRVELGSHLGLTLETVSRCLSRLREEGIVELHLRKVRILDLGELARVADGRRTFGPTSA